MMLMAKNHKAPQLSLELLVLDRVKITGGKFKEKTGTIVEDPEKGGLDVSLIPVRLDGQGQEVKMVNPSMLQRIT